MSADALLLELRRQGIELSLGTGDRIRYRAAKGAFCDGLKATLTVRKAEILAALRRPTLTTRVGDSLRLVAFASLRSRFDAVGSWLAANRPDLIAALAAWEAVPEPIWKGRDVIFEGLEAAAAAGCVVEQATEAEQGPFAELDDLSRPNLLDARSVRIWSRVLDAELWIAADEQAAAELQGEGISLPILLPSEAMILGRMAEKDARTVFATLRRVQRVMPGSRLRNVGPRNLDA